MWALNSHIYKFKIKNTIKFFNRIGIKCFQKNVTVSKKMKQSILLSTIIHDKLYTNKHFYYDYTI